MNPPKQAWDTRAWLIGILGGAIGGNITIWVLYPPIQKRLNTVPHFSFIGNHTAEVISGISGGLTLLILPGLLSGLAHRWTFLWGILPLSLFLAVVDIQDWLENGIKSVVSNFWISLLVISICWVVSSGPVSLIRWQRVRAKQRQAAIIASYQTMREAASVPQEGVWPPPPKHNVL